jgi:asparagine synthase (glutamine-hydrolysing)
MLPALEPRGPDDEGVHVEPGLAMGHRRLAIIDLSPTGHQPMRDPGLPLSITYNGEIYNYRELRKELEGEGYRFFSDSDTEVLLKGYDAWGLGFLERLYGMFAFCLHDRQRGEYLLVRDRLGIKPLYYTRRGDRLYFASNIQSLHAAGAVDGRLSPVALHHYLSFHAVVPPPLTLFEGVHKLEPGSFLRIRDNGLITRGRFWDLECRPDESIGEEEWVERVLAALRLSVERRLVADVPVGALLSGGVDSSLIVGLMAERVDSLHTYSIGFADLNGEDGNEFPYSDLVASRFATEHHRIEIDSRRLLPGVVQCLGAMAEPMVSHDAVGFYLLSQEVSKHNKVVLSGQGADEIFGGYSWYPRIQEDQGSAVERYRRHFFDRDDAEVRRALTPELHPEGDPSSELVSRYFDSLGSLSAVDKALLLDTRVMLVDDPVKRVDNMTMAWGLEGRVPFLDHEVVELAFRIPAGLKIRGSGKHILKKAAERVIPREVIYRPKGYFPVPALKYLRGEYLALARDALTSTRARERGLFRNEYVEELLSRPEDHMTPLGGSKLWQLAVLELWLQGLEQRVPAHREAFHRRALPEAQEEELVMAQAVSAGDRVSGG